MSKQEPVGVEGGMPADSKYEMKDRGNKFSLHSVFKILVYNKLF